MTATDGCLISRLAFYSGWPNAVAATDIRGAVLENCDS
jgi:hypothetical protein